MRPNQNFINSLTIRDSYQFQISATNPYTYVAGKFTASSDWLFGRTSFNFEVNGVNGAPVATGMVIYDTVGNIIDITGGSSTVFGSPNYYVIWEPTAGTGTLVNGTAYWIAFTITSGGSVYMKPGNTVGELLYTNGSPASLVGTGTPISLKLNYTP